MGDSNGAWGELAQRDNELAEAFDQYERLPEPGENPALDAFVDRKHLSITALVRLGARINPPSVLVFPYPRGLKFRDMVTDQRWNYIGSEFAELKLVPAGRERSSTVILSAGETDGARLAMLYPGIDIAILGAGEKAKSYMPGFAAQLAHYELALLAFDPDKAGDDGYAMLTEHMTTRYARWNSPEGGDWSDHVGTAPPLPSPEDVDLPVEQRALISLGEMIEIPPPEVASYLEQAMLPVGGTMVIHGAMKSFKSFLAFDLAAALAQATSWAGFEVIDEPQLVAVLQYEVPWAYYQERLRMLEDHARAPELLRQNFLGYRPMARPSFRAGNAKQEDAILATLDAAGVTVFVLDPIRRAAGVVDLNSEKEVRPMLQFFERLNREGITVIMTHHDNKDYSRRGSGDPYGMTGSGAFGGDPDSIVSVAVPKGCDITSPARNLHFLLRNAPSPGPRSMRLTDEGAIEYTEQPIGEDDEPPTPGSEAPSI